MDLVNYSQEVYERIVGDYVSFARGLDIQHIEPIPLSALAGDNVTEKSGNMPWYAGPDLMSYLETVKIATRAADAPFRMPVQWVNRPEFRFPRLFRLHRRRHGLPRRHGQVSCRPAARVASPASSWTATLPFATAGQSVTLTLSDEIDCSRGDVIVAADNPAEVSDQFETTIVWMNDTPMLPGRTYLLKLGTKTVPASISALKHKINVNTLEEVAARQLTLNEIGLCNISLSEAIAFDPYSESRDLGGFILIDRFTNETVAAGMIHFALRRANNIHWQALDVTREKRAAQKGQQACVLWFTGLSGSGKSTIANLVEKRLFGLGKHSTMLDGDNVRHGLNRDLGFTAADRVENIRRVAEVTKLMADAGLIVLTSFISPFRSERQMARDLLPQGEFLEIFIDTPLDVAEARDPKGLYKKARRGEIKNFTGISSPYEAPEDPEIRIDTTQMTSDEAADLIIRMLEERGLLRSAA